MVFVIYILFIEGIVIKYNIYISIGIAVTTFLFMISVAKIVFSIMGIGNCFK